MSNMDELIYKTHKQWEAAKSKAQRICEKNAQYGMAQKLKACAMFKGNEDLEGLVKLMFTPRGIEFMTRYHFPDIETLRKFKERHPERYGVYIDCGKISLSEKRKVFLIGDTVAEIKYRDMAGNRLHLMCGATAHVTASGYSVVRIEKDEVSKVSFTEQDHAKILI